jgi:4-azaleucine resistance transporter AzlC
MMRRGALAAAPLLPGVVAFGLLYGVMARQVGFRPWEALAMSVIVHAGSAQFVALGMWNTSGPPAIIATTLIINLRHLLMGASIAPYLRQLPTAWKALLALWMSDETYALALAAYEQGQGGRWYFLGANLCLYVTWALSGFAGALLGGVIPDPSQYGLDLVFPLAFLGLLVVFLKDRLDVTVALASGGLALLGALFLPGSWYVVIAGLLGATLGLLLEARVGRWRHS